MVERWPVKPEVESSSLSGIADNYVNCFRRKVKVCREQKIFTPNTKNTDKLFSFSTKQFEGNANMINTILGKNKVCSAQKFKQK